MVGLSGIPSAADDSASNLVPNPGFEEGQTGYYLFVAPDSTSMNCRYTIDTKSFHSGAQSALMQADDFARFAVGPAAPIPVGTGERYKVGVWVKAGSDFQAQPGTPGVVLRLNLFQNNGPSPSGLILIYLNNTVSQGVFPAAVTTPLSKDWTHIEAVVEVPAAVDGMSPVLFSWKGKGSLNVDDFTLEKVDATTPVSTVVPGGSSP
jgi:hypothetical protein